jgi:hypothetical protein
VQTLYAICAALNRKEYLNIQTMNFLKFRTPYIVNVVLLLCMTISFLWCFDNTCQDEQEDDCTCLICSLLNEDRSEPTSSTSHHANSCSCVCQVPFSLQLYSTDLCHLNPEILLLPLPASVLNQPRLRLFRPPRFQALFSDSFSYRSHRNQSEKGQQCLGLSLSHHYC